VSNTITENERCIIQTSKTLKGKDAKARRRVVVYKAEKKVSNELKRITQSLDDINFLLKLSDPTSGKVNPLTKRIKLREPKIDFDELPRIIEAYLRVIDSYLKQTIITRQEREVERIPADLGKLPPGICRSHSPSGTKWLETGPLSGKGNGPLMKPIGSRVSLIFKILQSIHQSVSEMRITYDTVRKEYEAPYDPKKLIIIEDVNGKLSLCERPSLHCFVDNYVSEKIGLELLSVNDYIMGQMKNPDNNIDYGKAWLDGFQDVTANHGDKPKRMILGRY